MGALAPPAHSSSDEGAAGLIVMRAAQRLGTGRSIAFGALTARFPGASEQLWSRGGPPVGGAIEPGALPPSGGAIERRAPVHRGDQDRGRLPLRAWGEPRTVAARCIETHREVPARCGGKRLVPAAIPAGRNALGDRRHFKCRRVSVDTGRYSQCRGVEAERP